MDETDYISAYYIITFFMGANLKNTKQTLRTTLWMNKVKHKYMHKMM